MADSRRPDTRRQVEPFDPTPGAYQAGVELSRLLAEDVEEETHRRTHEVRREVHYNQEGVSVVETETTTEEHSKRKRGGV